LVLCTRRATLQDELGVAQGIEDLAALLRPTGRRRGEPTALVRPGGPWCMWPHQARENHSFAGRGWVRSLKRPPRWAEFERLWLPPCWHLFGRRHAPPQPGPPSLPAPWTSGVLRGARPALRSPGGRRTHLRSCAVREAVTAVSYCIKRYAVIALFRTCLAVCAVRQRLRLVCGRGSSLASELGVPHSRCDRC